MHVCDMCPEESVEACKWCTWANPCLGCTDYDPVKDECTSNGGCAEGGD